MKKIAKKILEKSGYKIIRLNSQLKANLETSYQVSLMTLTAFKPKLKIVVVGANDGKINDPVYNFAHRYCDKTEIVLIEPQVELIPYLKENYRFHPSHHIFNCAIGPERELTLYSVKREYWKKINVKYGKDWPIYRVPTGITSSSKDYVKYWLSKALTDLEFLEDAILEFSVPCSSLENLLKKVDFLSENDIDVLQIDAEGEDDQVIFNSLTTHVRPKIIFFESKHLSKRRYSEVYTFLEGIGYELFRDASNTLAILVQYSSNTNTL